VLKQNLGGCRFKPLNAELNPICHLLALLGTHLILHVSRIRVNPYPANVENINTKWRQLDKMADNTAHRLALIGNRKACPTIL